METCNLNEPLWAKLRTMVDRAKTEAQDRNEILCGVIVETDKKRLTSINKIGGRKQAGDRALDVYVETIGKATKVAVELFERDENRRPLELKNTIQKGEAYRIGDTSDEGVVVLLASGKDEAELKKALGLACKRFAAATDTISKILLELPLSEGGEFADAHEAAGTDTENGPLRLSEFGFDIETGLGKSETNLKRFSEIFRHPEVVPAITHSIGIPFLVGDDPKQLEAEIARVEADEIWFRNLHPQHLRVRRGEATLKSPFAQRLIDIKNKEDQMESGQYIQIKFRLESVDAKEVGKYIYPVNDGAVRRKGTRKGHAEVLGYNEGESDFGMRAINTFFGKDFANRVMSIVASEMEKLGGTERLGVTIMPVDNHLRYYVDCEKEGKVVCEIVEEAIAKAMAEKEPGLKLKPVARSVRSKGIKIDEVGDVFELAAMNKEGETPQTIVATDYMVALLEEARLEVIHRALEEWEVAEYKHITHAIIDTLREIFDRRRTIRNTGDLVAILRNDKELDVREILNQKAEEQVLKPNATGMKNDIIEPHETEQEIRKDIEDWFFKFAKEHYLLFNRTIMSMLTNSE